MTTTRQAAFLRGINVGGNNRIAMADLRALVSDLGYADVGTHLQSGNVVYSAPVTPAKAAAAIGDAIASTLGLTISVVARSRKELAQAVAANPLRDVATDPSRHLVVFLAGAPTAAALSKLAAVEAGDERYELVGRDLFVWMPAGVIKSRVSAALGKGVLGVPWTGRNWNTVTKVLDLLDA
jgi:uncharacterized protein (DUF1697 family)